MKKKIIFITIAIVIISLYLTNPTRSNFSEYLLNNDYYTKALNTCENAPLILKRLNKYYVNDFNRKNYYIFSIYSRSDYINQDKYLGVFKNFVQINK